MSSIFLWGFGHQESKFFTAISSDNCFASHLSKKLRKQLKDYGFFVDETEAEEEFDAEAQEEEEAQVKEEVQGEEKG